VAAPRGESGVKSRPCESRCRDDIDLKNEVELKRGNLTGICFGELPSIGE